MKFVKTLIYLNTNFTLLLYFCTFSFMLTSGMKKVWMEEFFTASDTPLQH